MFGAAPLYLYAVAVGFVSAGLAGSLWNLVTGSKPHFSLLLEPSPFAPIRAFAVVAHAPLMIFISGTLRYFGTPLLALVLIAASLGWSFLQGVFILNQVFGLE
jgi:hypothetical protein